MTHNELGAMGEFYVQQTLTSVGMDVTPGKPADLVVDGWPLEVKAARPGRYRGDGSV